MLRNTMSFRLISNRDVLSVLFSHGQSLTSVQRAAFNFMSREMKSRQHPNKYSTSPGKRTYKPLLHTTGCKVLSPHQAQTTPWSHTALGQQPYWTHTGTAAPAGNFLWTKLTQCATILQRNHCHSCGLQVLAFLLAFAGKHPQTEHNNIQTPEQFSPALIFPEPADGFHCMLLL